MTISLSEIGQLISSIGFPIVMCLILVYFMYNIMGEVKDAINNLSEKITELIAKEEEHNHE